MANTNKIPDFLKLAINVKQNASRYAAVESEKFFKNSFNRGGFTDVSFVPWKKTGNPLGGNKTLYKNGDLQRNIHRQLETTERVIVVSDLSYSEIQNNGGSITVTSQMKKFFWAKYYEFAGKVKKTAVKGTISKSKSNIKTSSKAEFCKGMALKKVGDKIKIEERQYMGESKMMMAGFDEWFGGHIEIMFMKAVVNAQPPQDMGLKAID